jgi:predicted nucleic acid-binding protein
MSVAYVDSSAVVAWIFGEQTAAIGARRLQKFEHIVSANLLEAEVRAACVREGVDFSDELVSGISWIIPDRPIGVEISRVLQHGYIRGADCWHLATALYLAATDPSELEFITLDKVQAAAARALGFRISYGVRESR